MEPICRVAQPADISAITPMWREAMVVHSEIDPRFPLTHDAERLFSSYLVEKISDPAAFVYVAEMETVLVAYCIAQVITHPPIFNKRHSSYINDLMVAPAFRRQGIGHALFKAVATALGKSGARDIEVSFMPQNVMSSSFWRKLGFSTRLETARLVLNAT